MTFSLQYSISGCKRDRLMFKETQSLHEATKYTPKSAEMNERGGEGVPTDAKYPKS